MKSYTSLVEKHRSIAAAARALRIPVSTFKGRLKREKAVPAAESETTSALMLQLKQARGTRIEPVKQPPKARPGKDDFVRVIIPDSHGDHIARHAAAAFLADCARLNPHEIVMLGDHLDCGGFLAQHHTMGYVAETETSYEADVMATNQFLDEIQKAAPRARIKYLEGNHECLSPDTEVLCRDGWRLITDVSTDDLVASMYPDGTVRFDNPSGLVRKPFDGELFVVESSNCAMSVTPKHRLLYKKQSGAQAYKEAETAFTGPESRVKVFSAGRSSATTDLDITDDELRLTAWLLTDGHVNGRVGISQSKTKGRDTVRELLSRMGLEFTEQVRQRDITEVCGRTLKSILPQGAFDLLGESRRVAAKLVGVSDWHYKGRYAKRLPPSFVDLSDRQFSVLLESMMDGDGTRVGAAYCLYGMYEPLSDFQMLCALHGYRAGLTQRNRGGKPSYWCLNITKRSTSVVRGENVQRVPYSGDVYCLVMPQTNFCIRYKGKVHFTGNCRVEKWCVTQALRNKRDSQFLLNAFGPEAVLGLKQRGIEYFRSSGRYDDLPVPGTIKLGECCFTHGIFFGQHAAQAHASRFGCSVVFGHIHRSQSVVLRTVGKGVIGAWSPGCLAQLQPLYAATRPTDWTHGYGVQIVARSGKFLHLNIPIIDGESLLLNGGMDMLTR